MRQLLLRHVWKERHLVDDDLSPLNLAWTCLAPYSLPGLFCLQGFVTGYDLFHRMSAMPQHNW